MTSLHEPLDRYSRASQTWLHRAPAVAKLLVAFAMIAAFCFTPHTLLPGPAGLDVSMVHVLGGLLLLVAIVWAGIPLGYVASRLLAIAPILVAIALSVPLGRHFDDASWTLGLQLVTRGLLCFLTVLVLVNTTPIEALTAALRRLGAPALLVTIFSLMVRYQSTLLDELGRMRRARLARTFDRRGTARWTTAAGLIGRALVRSYERSERVHAAMLARGYDDRQPR